MPLPMRSAAIVSACVYGVMALGSSVHADDAPGLFLTPTEAARVIDAVRAAEMAAEPEPPRRSFAAPRVPAPPATNIIPRRFHIPDGYEIDFDRDPPRFATPVDRDNMVSFELFDRGIGIFLDYDEESVPIGDGAELLFLQIERRF